jgi:DNA-binding transcriptional MerR regulator
MVFPPGDTLISSKDILDLKGISRATLNNYIRMGLLPKPVVRRPLDDMRGVRKIGYFPVSVLERIDHIGRLKRQGYSMEAIVRRFAPLQREEEGRDPFETKRPHVEEDPAEGWEIEPESSEHQVRLTFDDVALPAYLLNYRFDILWLNSGARAEVLKHKGTSAELLSKNLFRLLFNWEFHARIQNWKDLVSYHMRFAKIKYARGWMENLYEGISPGEIHTLQDIYDRVSPFPKKGPIVSRLNLLDADGTTVSYQVISLFFKEGLLFIYSPTESLYARNPEYG